MQEHSCVEKTEFGDGRFVAFVRQNAMILVIGVATGMGEGMEMQLLEHYKDMMARNLYDVGVDNTGGEDGESSGLDN